MDTHFVTDADLPHATACARLRLRAAPPPPAVAGRCWAWAPQAPGRPGPPTKAWTWARARSFAKLVPAEQVEQAAAQQFVQMQQPGARRQRALAPDDHPQLVRLRYIAKR